MLKECLYCGKPFDAGKRSFMVYCSRDCNNKHRWVKMAIHNIKTCKWCENEFDAGNDSRMEFCSKQCRGKYRKKNSRKDITCICKGCGGEFHPKEYDRTTYCSRECAYKNKTNAKDIKLIDKIKEKNDKRICNCELCGKDFINDVNIINKQGKDVYVHRTTRFCSEDCYKLNKHNEYVQYKLTDEYRQDLMNSKLKYAHDNGMEHKEHACVECGELMFGLESKKYCSKRCIRRVMKRNRRAMEKEQFVSSVYFNDVAKRCNNRCQLCGGEVLMGEPHPHPLSPCIDHIIPLAKGGTHEPSNVQLAHFICNSYKGASDNLTFEQLNLMVTNGW